MVAWAKYEGQPCVVRLIGIRDNSSTEHFRDLSMWRAVYKKRNTILLSLVVPNERRLTTYHLRETKIAKSPPWR